MIDPNKAKLREAIQLFQDNCCNLSTYLALRLVGADVSDEDLAEVQLEARVAKRALFSLLDLLEDEEKPS